MRIDFVDSETSCLLMVIWNVAKICPTKCNTCPLDIAETGSHQTWIPESVLKENAAAKPFVAHAACH